MGHWPSTRHIFDGYIGGATGGSPKDSGAESVGYIGGLTGGNPRDTGAESVGYIRGLTGGSPKYKIGLYKYKSVCTTQNLFVQIKICLYK
jgi:hypothetical protein